MPFLVTLKNKLLGIEENKVDPALEKQLLESEQLDKLFTDRCEL